MQNLEQINLEQSQEMLSLLSSTDNLTFQTFCESSNCKTKARTFNGSFKQHVKSLITLDAMEISPIACITAPEKRCGKTQFLNVISELVKRPMPTSNITAAALFRSIEKWTPTLLIDEADSFIKDSEDLRGILNAGHGRRSSYVIRTVGDNHEPKKFNVWGAKAISGIGHLPDTLIGSLENVRIV